MTDFQFDLLMRTLLAIFRLRLTDHTPQGWEKANKEFTELEEMFGLWRLSRNIK